MAWYTNLFQNQINPFEQFKIIDPANGTIILDPNISTGYKLNVNNECRILLSLVSTPYNNNDLIYQSINENKVVWNFPDDIDQETKDLFQDKQIVDITYNNSTNEYDITLENIELYKYLLKLKYNNIEYILNNDNINDYNLTSSNIAVVDNNNNNNDNDNNQNKYYTEVFLVIQSEEENKIIYFDSDIIWSMSSYLTDYKLTTEKNTYYIFTFFTYNNGKTWYGIYIGKYVYTENQSYIDRPKVYTCSLNDYISLENPRLLSIPYNTNTGLLPHYSTSWKICDDINGLNIVDSSFDNTTDLIFHEFDKTKLIENKIYYAFIKHNSSIKSSFWSKPLKIQPRYRTVVNPGSYRKDWFVTAHYIDLKMYHWYDPSLITRWIQTNSNNPNIIDIIDDSITGNAVILGNQYVEVNGIQGLLTDIKITFITSAASNIRLIPENDDNFVLYCQADTNSPTSYPTYTYDGYEFHNLNLWLWTRLKIIFDSNCVVEHIEFTLI